MVPTGHISLELLTKELLLLEKSTTEMRLSAIDCMSSIHSCMQGKKSMYNSQLKKVREISNMATRNALQVNN